MRFKQHCLFLGEKVAHANLPDLFEGPARRGAICRRCIIRKFEVNEATPSHNNPTRFGATAIFGLGVEANRPHNHPKLKGMLRRPIVLL